VAQFQIECVESNTEESRNHYSKFVLEPLERGQGTTVGNALRRVLLSNLEGTAVTAVRIAGVSHEFATVPGVREDVLEILMRMKEVILKNYSSQPQIGRLLVSGPATITAAHFDLPSEVEVIDQTQYVATIAEGGKLEMEFRIEKGKGYRTVERGREEATSLDFLQIDSIFMPVRKVNYSVEESRGEGLIPKDRLLLEVWTNGSVSPQEALSSAAAILVDLFNPLKDISLEPTDTGSDIPDDPNCPDTHRRVATFCAGI
jgi:DNA-directed RNA polymerase subunit alpha